MSNQLSLKHKCAQIANQFVPLDAGVGAAAIGDHSPSPSARKAAEQNTSDDDASAAAGKSDRLAPTQKVNAGKGGAGASLLDQEERASGRVSWGVYRGYFRLAQATALFLGVLLLSVTAQLTSVRRTPTSRSPPTQQPCLCVNHA